MTWENVIWLTSSMVRVDEGRVPLSIAHGVGSSAGYGRSPLSGGRAWPGCSRLVPYTVRGRARCPAYVHPAAGDRRARPARFPARGYDARLVEAASLRYARLILPLPGSGEELEVDLLTGGAGAQAGNGSGNGCGERPRPRRWCMKWPPRDLFPFKQELPLLSIQPH